MASTTQLFPPDFFQKIMDSASHQAAAMVGSLADQIRASSWKSILLLIVVVVVTKLLSGRIGSVIYDFFYFGILALIIAIWGWDIFFSAYFDIIYALLYPASYFLTGLVLQKVRG